jgi:hypothetical protein
MNRQRFRLDSAWAACATRRPRTADAASDCPPPRVRSLAAPWDALTGVFLGPGVPGGTAPAGLDSSVTGSLPTLSPLLQQVFFIGDGLTGTGSGAVQRFVVPQGATRLFLASSDDFGNNNNTGQFEVVISTK